MVTQSATGYRGSMSNDIGLLHPGEMGVTIGACALAAGHRVRWSSTGRSETTRARAAAAGFETCAGLDDLLALSDTVISVCPPRAAVATAEQVARRRFRGYYVDANAISPATAARVAATVTGAAASYIDGGIIGPPAVEPGTTRLYLSGSGAGAVARLFAGSALAVHVIGDSPTAASALKMCYAAWTKGSSALLLSTVALAHALKVDGSLYEEWNQSIPDLAGRAETTAARDAPKAWRFEAEMLEIANTFAESGLPPDFHRAAAAVFARVANLPADTEPDLTEVVAQLLQAPRAGSGTKS